MNEENTVIVLDVETTGLDCLREKMIEFAAVKLVNYEIVDEYETLINPEKLIRPSSMKIHGITDEEVADKPKLSEVMPKILEFIGDYPIVGHNVIFDYNFLNQACRELYDKTLSNQRIDSQHMFREVFPEEFSHGLSALLERFDVKADIKHRAMADAKNLAYAYPALRALYEQKYAWQLGQMPNIEYLLERYVRIQNAVQTMQAELMDIKSIFKIYFENGGQSVQALTGEKLIWASKVQYDYDIDIIKPVIEGLEASSRVFKLNNGLIDRMIDGISLDDEVKDKLASGRIKVGESRNVIVQRADKNNFLD
ncbi:MAG: 3'-5' exonuclease [Candidatus Gastranaerophilales bacterium]|nr:3'-5' exonuclease [Candidatus Gastranaerophilales bacterium]